jgi:transposase
MMGRQIGDQSQLFYLFNLEERIPARHLLRLINPTVTRVLAGVREKLQPFYSDSGRPSIDPELMIRMLLCEEVELHLAYRWFCRLALDDKVPHFRRSQSIGTDASGRAICSGRYSKPW